MELIHGRWKRALKYLGTRVRGGPKEYGSESKPILQERKENNQERKLKHGTLWEEGRDACTKRNKVSIVSWIRKSAGDL